MVDLSKIVSALNIIETAGQRWLKNLATQSSKQRVEIQGVGLSLIGAAKGDMRSSPSPESMSIERVN